MDARRYLPVPPELQGRLRTLTNDLQRAKVNLAEGRLHPEHYSALSRVLDARLRDIEAEVHARLLQEARVTGRATSWQPKGPRGGAT